MLKESKDDFVIAVDSSGVKVSNRGEWIREKWKVYRGWIKIHIAVNVNTKEIIALEVADERIGDGKMLKPLIEKVESCIILLKKRRKRNMLTCCKLDLIQDWTISV